MIVKSGNRVPKVINFDLDGTVVNVEKRFHRALNRARLEMGLPEVGLGDFSHRYRTGRLSRDLLPENVEPFWRMFLDRFCFDPGDHLGEPFPGVTESLDRIRGAGIRTAIITNRSADSSHVHAELETLGIHHHFDLVLSQGSFNFREGNQQASWCKSSMIRHSAGVFGVRTDEMAMVGDLASDITSARTAGCKWAVAVKSGGSPVEELEIANPDVILESIVDIPAHFGF